jgi:hypothetical protein
MIWPYVPILLLIAMIWVGVAWWALATAPKGLLDWRDQLAFAIWPVMLLWLVIETVVTWFCVCAGRALRGRNG